MSTTPNIATKPRPRRRRKASPAAKPKPQMVVGKCGRRAPAPPPFFSIQFSDGAILWQSTAALSRSECPHCIVDRLVEHGYLKQVKDGPLLASYPMHGNGQTGEFGPLSGLELCSLLQKLSVPDPHRLGGHQHDQGAC